MADNEFGRESVSPETGSTARVPLAFVSFTLRASPARGAQHQASPDLDLDDALWSELEKSRSLLQERIQQAAKEFFGPDVSVDISLSQGSIVLGVLITAGGALALYRSSVENIQWFVGHVRGLISEHLRPFAQRRRAVVEVAPGRVQTVGGAGRSEIPRDTLRLRPLAVDLLLAYVLITQAGLLGILGWLLVTKV